MKLASRLALTARRDASVTVMNMKLSITHGHRARWAPEQRLRHLARRRRRRRQAVTCGTARVAIVHVGEIADAHGDLWPALHGTKLEPLHDAYFAQGWYKDDYADGAGIDLLYIESIEIDAGAPAARTSTSRSCVASATRSAAAASSPSMPYGDALDGRPLGPPRLRAHARRAARRASCT